VTPRSTGPSAGGSGSDPRHSIPIRRRDRVDGVVDDGVECDGGGGRRAGDRCLDCPLPQHLAVGDRDGVEVAVGGARVGALLVGGHEGGGLRAGPPQLLAVVGVDRDGATVRSDDRPPVRDRRSVGHPRTDPAGKGPPPPGLVGGRPPGGQLVRGGDVQRPALRGDGQRVGKVVEPRGDCWKELGGTPPDSVETSLRVGGEEGLTGLSADGHPPASRTVDRRQPADGGLGGDDHRVRRDRPHADH
jgi:hypothetical protein